MREDRGVKGNLTHAAVGTVTQKIPSPAPTGAVDRLYRADYGLGLVCIHSLDGCLLSVSPAGAKALGYEPQEMVGRAMRDFLPEDVRHQLPAYLDRIRQDGTASGLMRVLTKSGDERILAYSNICRHEAGEPVCVLGHAADITELKRAEQQLRAAEQRFCSLVQCRSDAVAIVRADGSIQYVSPAVQRALGYSPEQVVGLSLFDYVHPDDVLLARKTFGESLQKPGHEIPLEVRLRNLDGAYVPFDVIANNLLRTPGVAGIVIAAKDVSGRKLVEREREKQKEELERSNEGWGRAIAVVATSTLGFLAVLLANSYVESRRDKNAYRMMFRAIKSEAANNKDILKHSFMKFYRDGFVAGEFFLGAAAQCCTSPLFAKYAKPSQIGVLNTYLRNLRLANDFRERAEQFRLYAKKRASQKGLQSLIESWDDSLKRCRESINEVLALRER